MQPKQLAPAKPYFPAAFAQFDETTIRLFETPGVVQCWIYHGLEKNEVEGHTIPGNSGSHNICTKFRTTYRVMLWWQPEEEKRKYGESVRPTLREAITEAFTLAGGTAPAWVADLPN